MMRSRPARTRGPGPNFQGWVESASIYHAVAEDVSSDSKMFNIGKEKRAEWAALVKPESNSLSGDKPVFVTW